jgi:hypothetical protein
MNTALLLVLLQLASTSDDSGWSKEAVVRRGNDPIVRFQARIDGDHLIIKATHEEGWHSYAMDNELRAATALKGKMSLGIEQGIDVKVEQGMELDDHWLQTEPNDYSKPELRWFTYGFGKTAFFACRAKKLTSEAVTLRIKGQACSGDTCCQVDVTLKVQAMNQPDDEKYKTLEGQVQTMLKDLVPVMTSSSETTVKD